MDDKKLKIIQKDWFKNLMMIGIPSVISAIGCIISLIPSLSQTIKNTLILIIVFSMVIHIIFVLLFSSQENKIYEKYNSLKKDNDGLLDTVSETENKLATSNFIITIFSELFDLWSNNINSFSKNVLMRRRVSDKSWDKIKYFDLICRQCKNMINKYCSIEDNLKVSVGFVIYKESETNEKTVHMIAHSNTQSTRPKACKDEEKLSECNYHYAELIREGYTGIEVKVSNEEIRNIFRNTSSNTDLSKYTQYIAIPVYCSSNKLLGIFQVVTMYGCIIEQNRIDLLEFAEENIIPFSNLIVLIEKINKGLYVNPGVIEMEE